MQELGVPDLLGEGEPDMAALQRLASDPDMLLGAMQSDQQRQVMPQLAALVAIIEGYVDHVLDTIGGRLLPDYDRVTEALRRRRVEAGPQTRFVERLFGLELSQATFDRGADFVDGVVDRAGVDALALVVDHRSITCPPRPTSTLRACGSPVSTSSRRSSRSTTRRSRSRISSIFRTRTDGGSGGRRRPYRLIVESRWRPLATLTSHITRPAGHGS